MATNISLNQFAPNAPIAGLYCYMANLPQLHNIIVSKNQETPLYSGAVVTLDPAATNPHASEVLQAQPTDSVYGVVSFNPIGNQFGFVEGGYTTSDRVSVARENDIIFMPAAGAIAEGAKLYFTADNEVTSTATAGNSIVGIATTPAKAKGDFVKVQLKFETTGATGGEG